MEDLSHFLSLRKVTREAGLFLFRCLQILQQQRFQPGRISNVKNWKESYFYVFNTDRARTQFNAVPSKVHNIFPLFNIHIHVYSTHPFIFF